MGWITNFFGGTEAATHVIKKAADGVYNGIDKAIYTDEEKSEDKIIRLKSYLDFAKQTLDENSIRNVTRRWLAWGVVGWTLINAQVAIVYAIRGQTEVVQRIIDVAVAFQIGMAFLSVMGLYFGVQFFRGKK